ncbi:hypothetical protein DIPPA_15504 [Diplonema papillatum]|nr:hypothetical protein DIPPA_15504 [Diplonema papillatum]
MRHAATCTAKRLKTSYASSGDRKTSMPSAKAVTPSFVQREDRFAEQFYKKDISVGQALQFMQAGQVPRPAEKERPMSYHNFMNNAMSGGDTEVVTEAKPTPASPLTTPDGRPLTNAELRQRALQIEREALSRGRQALDIACTVKPMDHDPVTFEELAQKFSHRRVNHEIPSFVQAQAIEEEKRKAGAVRPPELDNAPGRSDDERRRNYERQLTEWEQRDRLSYSPAVAHQKKNRAQGSPVMTDWSKTDEASYSVARRQYMNHFLSKPGWTLGNFAVMYANDVTGMKVGSTSTKDIRGPEWQL